VFKTDRIACYLNGFAGHGEDNDNKELKLIFHVTPITPELAAEISPWLADRLFRKTDGEWEPAREITKASFANLSIKMQNITFHAFPEASLIEDGILIPGCAIGSLRAQRATVVDWEFQLAFDVVLPMNRITMDLVEKYYKATSFLTMKPVQRDMEYAEESAGTETQQASLQEAADSVDDEAGQDAGKPKKRKRRIKDVTVQVGAEASL
jgi:hypothetical protein